MATNHDPDGPEGKRKREGDPTLDVRIFKRARSEPSHLMEYIEPERKPTPQPLLPPSAPCRIISREAMAMVKEQLSQLTLKNRGMKAAMQEMREAVVGELMSIMKTRRIVLEQLGRAGLEQGMRRDCKELLIKRKDHMTIQEEELIALEKLLSGHEAVLEHADSACLELEEKIRAYEQDRVWESSYTMRDFPQMSALARLTGGGTTFSTSNAVLALPAPNTTIPSFTLFVNLPFELRTLIWKASFPERRVITHDSRHNRELTLLAVCRESRSLVEKAYARMLSPGAFFPLIATSYTYINLETDIVVRDLTLPPDESGSLFDLEGSAFNLRCFALLSGLAKVKHLAIGFDLLNENGGELFGPLQACCPRLKSLTLFPSSQMRGYHRNFPPDSREIRFLNFDSNFNDYLAFRWNLSPDRIIKRKAYRGLMTLEVLANHALQYADVFPQYIRQFGQQWNPVLKICMLTKWNEVCQGWQTRYMDTDRYSRGFPGEDGTSYRGFIESGMICDKEGEVLSRYDGVRELFDGLSLR